MTADIAQETTWLLTPVIQMGFAAFSAILLGVIIWLIKALLGILSKTNEIIAANTEAIKSVNETTETELTLMRDLYNKVISRPCIAERE